ncbi:MAG: biotin-dependent carboxyltransferase family protein [Proteobacteria bacterium]|nr:biotin-dependent carboxyltransferase family protein [Pseudomonadota bacterium]
MITALRIISPGPCTTVQDLGRFGAYHMGVPASGMLDDYAGQVANWLVGNPANCATLEMSMIGARMEILTEADIAVTGAAMKPQHNGRPCRQWTSIRVQPGDILEIGASDNGCRAYLAITGGIEVPQVLGSRSTYLGGLLGGMNGRMLAAGDILGRGAGTLLRIPRNLPWFPLYPENIIVRAIAGPHEGFFQDHLSQFFSAPFEVTAQCNRMGIRLAGPTIDRDAGAPESILSEPIIPGSVQVPAGGQPIVLLKEQTIGGYTSIATVVSTDIWRMGQALPGDRVHFVQISLLEAQGLYLEWVGFLAATKALLAN